VHVGGIVSGFRPLKTKKGDAMCVFSLEDHQGTVEVVVFPETYARYRAACDNGALLLVRGKFERDEESARLQATEILPLGQLKERLSRGVRIRLKADTGRETIAGLWDVVAGHRGDRPLAIEVAVPGAPHAAPQVVTLDVNVAIRVRPSQEFVAAVERLCGPGSVHIH
jgi:DNA polymerase-3 subunit alpha